ncbi:site-2 protease family protein [Candidatus Woesearchaeota archaeon]|nr:site-2 protease family protein [Candidatus Woesearchaeota archaeon]MBT4114707.1 site-2 protease family protein [Candidatus Woesearchaeota archaeon]MBT4248163.1 site-2 protease family protein [Candidatus Woesearchaeota archaeon]
MEFNLNLLSIFLFYGLIIYFIVKNKSKIEFHKLYLLYKTKRGISLIDRLSKHRVWKYWGYIGIPVGFIGMFFILGMLLVKVWDIVSGKTIDQGVQLLLPWTSSGSAGPFMLMPFWTFIICIAVVVLVHEGAHGIISRVHKLKLRSTGLGMFTIIPLAFVEPDEAQMEKAPLSTQLSIFAAGPFANICTGIFALLISLFFLIPLSASFFDPAGLEITDVKYGFPAEEAGIVPGDTIMAVDSQETLNVEQFVSVVDRLKPGDTATFLLQDREVTVNTVENAADSDLAYVGISFKQKLDPVSDTYFGGLASEALLYLITLFGWLWVLNIGIGLVNLLPLGPVDGGRMLLATSHKLIKNESKARIVWMSISILALLALVLNIVAPFLMSIFA